MDAIAPLEIVVFIILALLSGFFSSVEAAMHSLDKITIKKILSRGGQRAHLLELWTSEQSKFLSALYFGSTILNVGATVLASSVTVDIARLHGYYEPYALATATGIITLFLLLFGEVAPKTIAKHNPEKMFLLLAAPINFTLILLRPFSAVFNYVSKFVVWILGGSKQDYTLRVTEAEIRDVVEAGEIEEVEKEMIHSVIEFGDTIVKEIMVPRVDMICVDVETPMHEILDTFDREKLSRIPVYENTIDTIVGIIHIKNILNSWRKHIEDMTAIEFISLPYFIPETKKISELLHEFQSQHLQIAVVVDEYGGTAGLVTMEDLIEEIVGEITDEYDEHGPIIKKQEDGSYLMDSKVEIHLVNEQLRLQLPSEEYHTIGGFILWLFKRMPKKNESINYQNLKFTVCDADRKRIHKIALSITP